MAPPLVAGSAIAIFSMACLWHLAVLVFDNKSLVSGVILNGEMADARPGTKSKAIDIIGTYFRQPLAFAEIGLRIGNEQFLTQTDSKGSFSLDLDSQVHEEVEVYLNNGTLRLEPVQDYPSYFGPKNGKLHIISDMDDTVIVSHTASLTKRIKALLTPVHKRKTIDFTHGLISALLVADGRIYYVSKSESNLFGMLSSFIREHGLPVGHLFLTPYLKFLQLLNPKKGKTYKMDCIQSILDRSDNKFFILLGDDTQRDMEVYYEIARMYPRQILKIYIRRTGKELLRSKKRMMANLQGQPIPFLYYSDTDSFSEEVKYINQLLESVQ